MSAKAEILDLLEKLKTAIENLGVTETVCTEGECEAPKEAAPEPNPPQA